MSRLELSDQRIWVAGHRGMVGRAVVQALKARGTTAIITRAREELDLLDQSAVRRFMDAERPDVVVLAAAKVGGILANDTQRADFIYQNLVLAANVIGASHEVGVRKLLNLGSSCIYPKLAPQPLREDYLLTGPLEPTNEPYAIAKIAAIKLCESFRRQYGDRFVSAMPTNLYGPHDNFDPQTSHVLPALIRRFHEAKLEGRSEVVVWGSGRPRREFLHVEDCADAVCFLLEHYDEEPFVNVGCGEDLTIGELARLVAETVDFAGAITFDTSKPDGTPRKLLSVDRLRALGWKPRWTLADGLRATYTWFVEHRAEVRGAASR